MTDKEIDDIAQQYLDYVDGTKEIDSYPGLLIYLNKKGMLKEPELKPCPFCRSNNVRPVSYSLHKILCDDCKSSSHLYSNYEKAKAAWNRRVE